MIAKYEHQILCLIVIAFIEGTGLDSPLINNL